MQHIAVLRGGWSEEREVSLKSGQYVLDNLDRTKYKVTDVIVNNWQDILKLADLSVDVAFLALHGKGGEDGRVQSLLELMGIRYTGASVEASVIGFDKFLFKQVMRASNVNVPKDIVLDYKARRLWIGDGTGYKELYGRVCLKHTQSAVKEYLSYPVFVKPDVSGSSFGVTKVKAPKELTPAIKLAKKFGNRVIIEQAIEGLELTIGFVGKHLLPPVLIKPKKGEFFDYASKYEQGGAEEICPAPVSKKIQKALKEEAKNVIAGLGDVKYGRIDAMYSEKEDKIYILEINTLPGMTPTSLLPQEARAYGWTDARLLEEIIEA